MEVMQRRGRQQRRRRRSSISCARWRPSPVRICATPGRRSTRTTLRRSSFTLTNEGSRKFGKVTGDNIGRSLAIVLDNRVVSAPRIDGRITSDGIIYGSFTTQEVADLSLTLRSGALPA